MHCEELGIHSLFAGEHLGIYTLRQIPEQNILVWVGQQDAPSPRFANVFIGRYRRGQGSRPIYGRQGDKWVGHFWDIPLGQVCASGPLELEIFSVTNPRISNCEAGLAIRRSNDATPFGERWLLNIDNTSGCVEDAPRINPDTTAQWSHILPPAAYDGLVSGSLTGVWAGDDGGVYYIRHLADRGSVIWFAQSPDAQPQQIPEAAGIPSIPGRGFAHVFIGSWRNNVFGGDWYDINRGGSEGFGRLRCSVEGNEIRILDATGGFGGRRLVRMGRTAEFLVEFDSIRTTRTWDSSTDQPLVFGWVYAVSGMGPDGRPQLDLRAYGPVRLPDLTNNGVASPFPANEFRFELDVSPGMPEPRIGVLAQAFEADGTSDDLRLSRLVTVTESIRQGLDQMIASQPDFTASDAATHLGLWADYSGPWEGWPFGDADDYLGRATMIDPLSAFPASGPSTLPLPLVGRENRRTHTLNVRVTNVSRITGGCMER